MNMKKINSELIVKEIIFIHRFQCDGKTLEVLVMPAKNKRGLTFPQVNKFDYLRDPYFITTNY